MIEIIKCSFFILLFMLRFRELLYLLLALLGFNPDKGRDGDRRGLASMLLACTYTGYNLKPILD